MALMNLNGRYSTKYPELKFRQDSRDNWRIVDASNSASIGPSYPTRAALLADLDAFAVVFGAPGAYAGPDNTRAKLLEKAGQHALDYFTDTGECLFCDVDAAHTDSNGTQAHESFCPLKPLSV